MLSTKLFLPLVFLAAAVLLAACTEAQEGDRTAQGLTDPRVVPTATPWATPPPAVFVEEEGEVLGPEGGTYTVQEGDYPAAIAERFGVSVEELMEVNNITDPTTLRVGQELIIPGQTPEGSPTPSPTPQAAAPIATPGAGGEIYVVQDGDTAYDIASALGVSVEELAEANDMTVEEIKELSVGQELKIPQPQATVTPSP